MGCVVATVLLLLLAPAMWDLYWHVPGRLDFWLHRREYQRILQQVQAQSTHGQEFRRQMIGGVEVSTWWNPDGSTSFLLKTADWGHFGQGGYTYGSPLPPGDGIWQNGDMVAPGWQAVYGSD